MSGKLPIALLASLEQCAGFNRNTFEAVHAAEEKVTSVRFNPAKGPQRLASGLPLTPVPWCRYGAYLPERPSFTFDPLFHAGTYYVQEASSMFLWEVLHQVAGNPAQQKVLDLCAAPGGKSTLLASYFADGLVVANEVIRNRSSILAENITKWGADNVVVTNNDPAHFQALAGYFDVIVADAPCSGSGLFRKDPEAIEEWSEDNVALCSQRQQRILADIYPALKEEGILIYSTCSYSKQEDEEILDWLMQNFALESCSISLEEEWGIIPVLSEQYKAAGYRFYPDKVKGEGFFIAAFRKKESSSGTVFVKKNTLNTLTKQEVQVVGDWLKDTANLFLFKQKDTIIAVPEQWKAEVLTLQQSLHIKKAGVAVGMLKGKDLVPEHALALSLHVKDTLPKLNLELEQALQYLRKKEVDAGDAPKGWTLAQFEGVNLGWMKVLPGRINNYYPVEWRILKD
ncbi:16S rRNA C967 or C1407 C5-methylase, RsmB/RsmF family [Filimonas lacunae]|uniref:16S rRNA C967 or C1407 C5-methylase, RsmB/RsmF family n=1 Tax=Filimonas lacunae TaxID=477680 RepID=A0A173ML94_9BACT|nr:tRNA and rRNA cytosine-C5-methylase [Filimonas lacunae]SIT33902.1 16S rRNA C967 or C1407 C5-methylase, RsmB/RsmF family [Filimonas lacunae]